MPELPEVEALADHLRRHAVGLPVGRVDVSALSVLKTFDPPPTALYGKEVTGANRWGKYLGLQVDDLHLITHLSRAGWLRWSEKLAAAPLKPGKGPIALRVHLGKPGEAPGFDLTEAGTQKRLAVWLVNDPLAVPQIASLGPDALSLGPTELGAVLAGTWGFFAYPMMDSGHYLVIMLAVVIGLVVLGPERLPGAIRWTSSTLRQARDYISGATSQLREDLGPEFDDLRAPLSELNKLRGMSPRAAITKHLLDGDDSLLSSVENTFNEAKSELVVPPAAAQRSPAVPAEPDPTLPTPFDPDAT